jgi:hypothetical protein
MYFHSIDYRLFDANARRDNWEDLDLDWKIVSKWILET